MNTKPDGTPYLNELVVMHALNWDWQVCGQPASDFGLNLKNIIQRTAGRCVEVKLVRSTSNTKLELQDNNTQEKYQYVVDNIDLPGIWDSPWLCSKEHAKWFPGWFNECDLHNCLQLITFTA